jgi:3-oxoadipate enol-lactonase
MPKVRTNGVELYYELHGPVAGEPLIFNNGVFANTASWAYQLPAFIKRYRVLLYDMRGQGQSEHPKGEYSLELHAQDLEALMAALGIAKAHVVGVSYGGELGLVLALRYPARVASLTVAAAVSHSDVLLRATIERWLIAARLGDARAFFRSVYGDVYSEGFIAANSRFIQQAEDRYGDFDLAAATRLMESFLRLDITAELPRIAAPTCVISAELDTLKPARYGRLMAQAIPGAEFHLIPNSGHAVMLERPQEFNTIVLGFLAKQGVRP